jgi:hypothetical protein
VAQLEAALERAVFDRYVRAARSRDDNAAAGLLSPTCLARDDRVTPMGKISDAGSVFEQAWKAMVAAGLDKREASGGAEKSIAAKFDKADLDLKEAIENGAQDDADKQAMTAYDKWGTVRQSEIDKADAAKAKPVTQVPKK